MVKGFVPPARGVRWLLPSSFYTLACLMLAFFFADARPAYTFPISQSVSVRAIPVFARKYGLPCSLPHRMARHPDRAGRPASQRGWPGQCPAEAQHARIRRRSQPSAIFSFQPRFLDATLPARFPQLSRFPNASLRRPDALSGPCENLCRPYGTPLDFPLDPGLRLRLRPGLS